MTDRDRKALEHDAILAELAALGEEPMEDDELTDAEGMAVAFDVLHGRAVSAVPAEASEQAFEGARLLLGGSEASALDGRSAALWGAVAARVAAPARSPDDELRTLGEASLVAGEADAASARACPPPRPSPGFSSSRPPHRPPSSRRRGLRCSTRASPRRSAGPPPAPAATWCRCAGRGPGRA